MKKFIKSIFKFFKIILIKEKNYYHAEKNLFQSLKFHNINSLIDVGAHQGNFSERILKKLSYIEVISFEPSTEVFKNLIRKSSKYKNWKIFNYALGAKDSNLELNISNFSEASSLLDIDKKILEFRPNLKTISKEIVKCRKIDSFMDEFYRLKKPIILKLDVQGYEMEILKVANQTLAIVDFVLIEVSIRKMYRQQPSLKEIVIFLEDKGFEIWSLDRVFGNKSTGETMQVNILFNKMS